MFLDRELQRTLLLNLRRYYPAMIPRREFIPDWGLDEGRDRKLVQNLCYLEEHGLVELNTSISLDEPIPIPGVRTACITSKGLDFLEDDGGLSAILGTVTVRLHADSIRDLVEAKILASDDVPEKDKSRLIETLKALSEEGLRQLTQRVVNYGLDQAPGAWQAVLQVLS